MKTWDTLYPRVLPKIVGMGYPNPTVDQNILEAAQDFCRRTRAWRVAMDPITTREGVSDYDLNLPPGSRLVRIEIAKLNGQDYPIWRDGERHICRRYVFATGGARVSFTDGQEAGSKLIVTASLKPSDDAPGMDDYLFEDYADVLAAGALSRLRPDLYPEARFIDRCDEIKTELWRGNAAINPRARAHFF